MDDVLPVASDEILSDINTLACHCGCRKALNNGKYYFNVPRTIQEVLQDIEEVKRLLKI